MGTVLDEVKEPIHFRSQGNAELFCVPDSHLTLNFVTDSRKLRESVPPLVDVASASTVQWTAIPTPVHRYSTAQPCCTRLAATLFGLFL